jgi:hypothetical protein
MAPQYFPWLFDDKTAWEKAIADPRYNYDLPIEYFMAIYQGYRTGATAASVQHPAVSSVFFSAAPLPSFSPTQAQPSSFAAPQTAVAVAEPEAKGDDSILSQSEIDALLAGLQ